MSEFERILLECRFIISLNKNYLELADYFHVNVKTINYDLNCLLPKYDIELYNKMKKMQKIKN